MADTYTKAPTYTIPHTHTHTQAWLKAFSHLWHYEYMASRRMKRAAITLFTSTFRAKMFSEWRRVVRFDNLLLRFAATKCCGRALLQWRESAHFVAHLRCVHVYLVCDAVVLCSGKIACKRVVHTHALFAILFMIVFAYARNTVAMHSALSFSLFCTHQLACVRTYCHSVLSQRDRL